MREVKEELSADIIPDTIEHFGTYEAQSHGWPEGKIIRITCYTACYEGEFEASSGIAPGDVIEKVDPIFYGDPLTAALKGLGMN